IVLQLDEPEDCRGCAFSADGKRMATNSGKGGVRLWDATTGKLLQELHPDNRNGGAYSFAAFSPDGTFLATGGHVDNSLNIWNLSAGKLACTLTDKAFFRSAFFSPDNRTLVCVPAATERAVLHNLVAEKEIYSF